jgi:hypothetical protein
LDRHAVFNRRISFSKGSDGLNRNFRLRWLVAGVGCMKKREARA